MHIRPRLPGTSLALLLAIASALLVAAPATAAPTCAFDEETGTVTVEVGEAETVTVARSTDAIAMDGTPCEAATVTNTDAVFVNATGTPTAVVLDLSGGPFGPGLTPEPDESSEIEFTISFPTGSPALRILGGPVAEHFVYGTNLLNLNASEATPDADVSIAGTHVMFMEGRAGSDTLSSAGGLGTGGPSPASLDGGTEDDLLLAAVGGATIVGGDGIDTVDYTAASQSLLANLEAGTVQHGAGPIDLLTSIENLTGSPLDDRISGTGVANVLFGGDGADVLAGGLGDDLLDGQAGNDTADFSGSISPVKVVLTGRSATGEGSDRLEGIENVIGSAFADKLFGDEGANRLEGREGDDRIDGADGDDTLDGGEGTDTALFGQSSAGVTVNLRTGTSTGAGSDLLSGFENVNGSKSDDTLTGDGGANVLGGGNGDDTIEGGGGNDRIKGGRNADRLFGQRGDDNLSAGPGNDQLNGGKGSADVCKGGADADSFVFCEILRLN